MANLVWMQTGACGGESMALLCADKPNIETLLGSFGINLLWHPSLSAHTSFGTVLADIRSGKAALDILCIEGSLILGPGNSGQFDTWKGEAKIDIVRDLAGRAQHVVAMGTCSAYGGVPASGANPTDSTGLQFNQHQRGGLLGAEWRSQAGQAVINVAGCPAHPNTMTQLLAMLASGQSIPLDDYGRPVPFFNTLVHQGCTRNEYHEYDIEDEVLGGRGCMFFSLGCRGPQTLAPCNADLWNGQNSKPRAGVPCFGCTSPDFPSNRDLFVTPKVGSVPKFLPLGVARAKYLAYKNLARQAAPERVINREMEP